ncbi:putative membrane protein YccC [Alkalihalobacillus xiaoxiensis]|uniref:Membrane protein YccC n=2 Tax=Shouchella xiaoxiensis TaxID=766895 RepID=A0ABS2SXR9_9BACI|nr:putative membrane protein YccC [Shouchella xiaoxiensis]
MMDRMYRVLGFWTGIFAVLFYIGNMYNMALLFFAQTVILVALGYLKLSERVYVYIFAGYCTVFFVGFTYYAVFINVPSFGH